VQHIVFVAIQPKDKNDTIDLEQVLLKVLAGDPTYDIETHEDSGETIVRAASEVQLENLTELLKRELPIEVTIGPPQVVFKETITQPAEGEARFTQRSGVGGLYAHARIRIAPGVPGSGYTFASRVAGDVIPARFVRSIEKGIRNQLTCGILSYPVDDIRVELFDGSFHHTDSSDAAFEIAGAMAFQDAEKKAQPIVLEPIMTAEIAAPVDYDLELIFDLSFRRVTIIDSRLSDPNRFVRASVPLAEILGYANDLRRQSHGRANCSLRFERYAPVPDSPEPDDKDRTAPVLAPLKPKPWTRTSGVALPEPDDD